MKSGKNLMELAAEVQRQAESKQDYIANTTKLEIDVVEGAPKLALQNGERKVLPIGDLAHRQIAERVGIPAKYYDKMRAEAPALLAGNVNHWFQANPERRLVRTLDGRARAFLSDRYQRIDNIHVAETVLPVLAETPGIEVVSSEVTESRLYIKAVTHKIQAEVKSRRVGDVVEAGVLVSNSEVGLGAVQVMPFFHFLVCTNGMVRNKEGLRSAHIGTKIDGDDSLAALLADDTRRTMDRAVLLKVRDVVRAAMDQARFMEAIKRMQEQTEQIVKGDPAKAIELLADDFALTDGERSDVLRHLIQGGDLSRYGVMNAVTRTAEDAQSYDRATEIESLGGRLLDLPESQWRRIAEVA